MYKKKLLIFFVFVGICIPNSFSQEIEKIQNRFQGTRFVNDQSANLAEKGELLLLIQHRFGDISSGFYELFGLDQASMRLGFEYGFGDNINVGVGRSTFLKTYDAFVKIRLVQQSTKFPFTAVFTSGGSLPTIRNFYPESNDNFSDKVSGNFQFHLAKSVGKIGIQLSPGFIKTGYLVNTNQNLSVFTAGIGGSYAVSNKVSANLEYIFPISNEISGENALSLGIDLDTGGHLFQLIISNNQRMFHQALYTNTAGKWSEGNLFFGFNLIREFDINKPLDFY